MSNNKSRTVNTIRNSSIGMFEYGVTILASFIVRTIFIRYMAAEYLGFNGLFTNILSMFSLAEMGIGNALGFMLYESLGSNDEHKTRQIMAFYRKVYIAIALVVLAIGLVLMPFIPMLIKEVPNVPESIYLIYFLYLMDSVASYLLSYQQAVIIRDQRSYIVSIGTIIYTISMSVGQILVLVFWQNFIAFLVVQFAFRLINNAVLAVISYKLYPFLKHNKEKLDSKDKKTIINDTKALLLYRISGIITSSTDNLIISKFIGIVTVGIYSNYYMITHACYSLIKKGITGISASAGNLFYKGSKQEIEKLFLAVTFFAYWIFGYFAGTFLSVLDPFVEVWAGSDFVLDRPTVVIIIVNFFIMGLSETYGVFRNAFGLFVQGRFRPVASAITNLVLSLIFVRYLGLFGVFLGTFFANIGFNYWFDPYVIYKYALEKTSKSFWGKTCLYIITAIGLSVVSYYLSGFMAQLFDGFLLVLVKCIVVFLVYNLLMVLFYHRTTEFKYIYNKLFVSIIKKVRKKS